jgi:hypothetical protein
LHGFGYIIGHSNKILHRRGDHLAGESPRELAIENIQRREEVLCGKRVGFINNLRKSLNLIAFEWEIAIGKAQRSNVGRGNNGARVQKTSSEMFGSPRPTIKTYTRQPSANREVRFRQAGVRLCRNCPLGKHVWVCVFRCRYLWLSTSNSRRCDVPRILAIGGRVGM